MSRYTFLALLLMLSIITTGLAQNPNPTQTPTNQQPAAPPPIGPVPAGEDEVVRITTNLVQVDAIVTKDGKPATDLQKEDFEIYEDGKRQEITNFAYISKVPGQPSRIRTSKENWLKDKNAPPTVGRPLRPEDTRRIIALVVDDLGLSAESMPQVKSQIKKFVTEQLDPNDLVAIIRTGGQMGALQQFTNNRRVIERAINEVKWNMCSRVGVSVLPPILPSVFQSSIGGGWGTGDWTAPCARTAGSTMSALHYITEAMGELPGRKAMVVFSDSIPVEDQEIEWDRYGDRAGALRARSFTNYFGLLNRIAERAIRSSIVIYAVDASGLQYTGPTAADSIQMTSSNMNDVLNSITRMRSDILIRRREGSELIAKQTGGFLVRNSNDFKLKQVLQDQTGYYLLGFRPTDETFNRDFHKIKAKVKKSGYKLRTRNGFYGITEEEASRFKRRPVQDRTTIALMSPFGAQEIEIKLTPLFAYNPKSGFFMRSLIYLNPKDLTFTDTPDGTHITTVELRGMIFGNNGAIAGEYTFAQRLTLTKEAYERSLIEGISLQFDLPVRIPGAYQYRVAVRDLATSKIGAAGEFVEVPDLKKGRFALSGIVMKGSDQSGVQTDNKPASIGNIASVRRFTPGSDIEFLTIAYNGLLDKIKKQPNMVMQVSLFRDDRNVVTTPGVAVDFSNQTDLERPIVVGTVHLSKEIEPGNYYLQLVITDLLSEDKKKPRQAIQWIDFEVVK